VLTKTPPMPLTFMLSLGASSTKKLIKFDVVSLAPIFLLGQLTKDGVECPLGTRWRVPVGPDEENGLGTGAMVGGVEEQCCGGVFVVLDVDDGVDGALCIVLYFDDEYWCGYFFVR